MKLFILDHTVFVHATIEDDYESAFEKSRLYSLIC